ncbi:hypothetical protein ACLB2K_059013 [Fragaria x ananassa]
MSAESAGREGRGLRWRRRRAESTGKKGRVDSFGREGRGVLWHKGAQTPLKEKGAQERQEAKKERQRSKKKERHMEEEGEAEREEEGEAEREEEGEAEGEEEGEAEGRSSLDYACLDDDDGNPPPEVVETTIVNGINVQSILSEEVVGNLEDNLDSDDAWGGTETSDSSDDDEDGGSEKGGGNTGFEYGQSSTVGGLNNFSLEENYNHGYRSTRYGSQEDTMYGRRTRGANDDQNVASVALSFESICLGITICGEAGHAQAFGYESFPVEWMYHSEEK